MKLRKTYVSFFLLASLLWGQGLVGQGAPTVIDLSSFGAHPDDGQDDILAIRNAIDSMVKGGGANYILRFQPGVYDLNPKAILGPPGPNNTVIFSLIANYESYFFLEIEGNGATLKCHGFDPFLPVNNSWYDLFYFNGIRDLQIHGLTVTMSRVPYTMGQCNAVFRDPNNQIGNNFFEVKVDPTTFPSPSSLANSTIHMLLHYPSPFYPNGFHFFYVQDSNPNPFASIVSTSTANQYRIQGDTSNPGSPGWNLMNDIPASPSYGKIRVGDYVLIDHQFGGYVVFSI
ncbi:MAG TPA: hypothetical protein ENK02_09255, partial [Planctomycetes bacterium]|nr:hypothetical protein [Planctomycetota bacterium]